MAAENPKEEIERLTLAVEGQRIRLVRLGAYVDKVETQNRTLKEIVQTVLIAYGAEIPKKPNGVLAQAAQILKDMDNGN